MQAIILAAGFGSRLRPLTDSVHKSLTEVNGKPILINELELLSQNGITETIIVTGYMHDKIEEAIGYSYNGMKITYVYNDEYSVTNNIYSLYLTKDYIKEDVLLLECDLFFENELIKKIIDSKSPCNVLVSKYNKDTMDGTVVKVDGSDRIQHMYLKKMQGDGFDYSDAWKTVNIYKFTYEFSKKYFFPEMELYVNNQSKNSYYELILGALIYYGNIEHKIVTVSEEMWAEIDDINDLYMAETKFK